MERTLDSLKVFGEVAPFKKGLMLLYYGSMALINTGSDEDSPSGGALLCTVLEMVEESLHNLLISTFKSCSCSII